MCYSPVTHAQTCHTQYSGNCESGYWFAGSDCNEADATCYATYNSYGRLCIEGGTSASGISYTALDGCCSFTHEDIAGYLPNSDVGDHEAIDIDENLLLNGIIFPQTVNQTLMCVDRGGGNLDRFVVIVPVVDEE